MKKEETQEKNAAIKKDYFSRSRSQSPKTYFGCDTCKLKSVKSNSKLSDCGVSKKVKPKTSPVSRTKHTPGSPQKYLVNLEGCNRRPKIKLTDLCDEDKKRLVLLIQELSIYADRNERLQTELDTLIKTNREQQSYIIQQANLITEEKKIHLDEINQYKSRIETIETEMKNAMSEWKAHEKKKNNEIAYLAKALKKSLKEKKDLHDEMNHLKVSLEHSLECFHKLKSEVTELQLKEQEIKYKSSSCQTLDKKQESRVKQKPLEEETEEDYFSINNLSSINQKSSIDVINDPVEHVYRIRRKDDFLNSSPRKCNLELLSNWNDENNQKIYSLNHSESEFDSESSKTSTDEQPTEEEKEPNILQLPNDKSGKFKKNLETLQELSDDKHKHMLQDPPTPKPKESTRDCKNLNFLQNKIVQENSFFKPQGEHQCDEDRLLEELFYTEQSTNMGFGSKVKNKKWVSYLSNFTK